MAALNAGAEVTQGLSSVVVTEATSPASPAVGDKRPAPSPPNPIQQRKKRKEKDANIHKPLVAILLDRNFPSYTSRSRVAKPKDVRKLAKDEDIDISRCQTDDEMAAVVLKALQDKESAPDGEAGGKVDEDDEVDDDEARVRDIVPACPSNTTDLKTVLDEVHGSGWQESVASVDEIKAKFSVEELRREIRRLCPGAKVTGDKTALATKLRNIGFLRATNPHFARRCLTATEVMGKTAPTVFHGDTFNAVDIFDLLMSSLAVDHSTKSENLHVLRWLVRLVFIHCHSLHSDCSWKHKAKEWHKTDKVECKRQIQAMKKAHKDYINARRKDVAPGWSAVTRTSSSFR